MPLTPDRTLSPRRFRLVRREDETGMSGIGTVAYGVEFQDGTAVMRWCTATGPQSTTIFLNVNELLVIHGHNGKTIVEWMDP
jgi:hypothetical protein